MTSPRLEKREVVRCATYALDVQERNRGRQTVDFSKFKPSDWMKVAGGLVFFICGFLAWWTVEVSIEGFTGGSQDATGLGDYFGTVGIAWLIFTAIAVLTVLRILGVFKLPPNVPEPMVFLIASIIALLLVIIRFFSDGFDYSGSLEGTGIDISRGIGNWLGTLSAIVIVVGCVLAFREAGGGLDDFKKLTSSVGGNKNSANSGTAGTPPPPPPPPPPSSTGTPPPPPPSV